jgi:hypothetical protein
MVAPWTPILYVWMPPSGGRRVSSSDIWYEEYDIAIGRLLRVKDWVQYWDETPETEVIGDQIYEYLRSAHRLMGIYYDMKANKVMDDAQPPDGGGI